MNDSVSSRPVAWITGATSGLGRATAHGLAHAGYDLVLAGRSPSRHAIVIEEVARLGARATHVELDLGDLSTVSRAVRDWHEPVALLVLNAGVAGRRGLTRNGFELAFGVNHLGHLLLTSLLMPSLRSERGRIITVASRAHMNHQEIDYAAIRSPTRTFTGWHEYGISKLANLWTSAALSRELEGTGVTTYALHPGVVATEIWKPVPGPVRAMMKLFMQTPEAGARTTLHCALARRLESESGQYYERSQRAEPAAVAHDTKKAEELMERSRAWLAPYLAM